MAESIECPVCARLHSPTCEGDIPDLPDAGVCSLCTGPEKCRQMRKCFAYVVGKMPEHSEGEEPNDPTPEYYDKTWNGYKIDVYRLARIYGGWPEPIFHAIKRLMRFGEKDGESERQSVEGAIKSLRRWLEMEEEDAEMREFVGAPHGPSTTLSRDTITPPDKADFGRSFSDDE